MALDLKKQIDLLIQDQSMQLDEIVECMSEPEKVIKTLLDEMEAEGLIETEEDFNDEILYYSNGGY